MILFKISLVRIWPDSIFKEGIIFTYSYTTQISPCNEDPLTPHLYIVKLAFTGVYFFLYLLQNIECVYTLEPPQRGGSNAYPKINVLSKIKKHITIFRLKTSTFTAVKFTVYCIGVFAICFGRILGSGFVKLPYPPTPKKKKKKKKKKEKKGKEL